MAGQYSKNLKLSKGKKPVSRKGKKMKKGKK